MSIETEIKNNLAGLSNLDDDLKQQCHKTWLVNRIRARLTLAGGLDKLTNSNLEDALIALSKN